MPFCNYDDMGGADSKCLPFRINTVGEVDGVLSLPGSRNSSREVVTTAVRYVLDSTRVNRGLVEEVPRCC